jgi:hypothetical protein
MHRLLVTSNVPSSPILVTLMMEALRSSETSVLQEPQGIRFQTTALFIYIGYELEGCVTYKDVEFGQVTPCISIIILGYN